MARANEQTQIIERDIQLLRGEQEKLNGRFDRHLEIYAANGKELSALKTEISHLRGAIERTTNEDARRDEKVTTIEVEQSRLITKVGITSGIGATAASTVVTFMLLQVLQ